MQLPPLQENAHPAAVISRGPFQWPGFRWTCLEQGLHSMIPRSLFQRELCHDNLPLLDVGDTPPLHLLPLHVMLNRLVISQQL